MYFERPTQKGWFLVFYTVMMSCRKTPTEFRFIHPSERTESLIEAVDKNKDRFVYEAADLLYHYLVLMEQMGISIADIEE